MSSSSATTPAQVQASSVPNAALQRQRSSSSSSQGSIHLQPLGANLTHQISSSGSVSANVTTPLLPPQSYDQTVRRGILTGAKLSDPNVAIPFGPLGLVVNEDEATVGPLYNFARIASHAQFVDQVLHGFREALQRAQMHKVHSQETVNSCICCSNSVDQRKIRQFCGFASKHNQLGTLADAYPVCLSYKNKCCCK